MARRIRSGSSMKVVSAGSGVRMMPSAKSVRPYHAYMHVSECWSVSEREQSAGGRTLLVQSSTVLALML
jgi:hypothetical protein